MEMLPLWPDGDKQTQGRPKRKHPSFQRKRGICQECGVSTATPSTKRCRLCAGRARIGKGVGRFSERICVKCGQKYTPNTGRQIQCFECLAIERTCVECGTQKRSRGPLCLSCRSKARIGKSAPWNSKRPPTPEEIIRYAEALGLVPDKYYAFGYVLGVVFGDGSVSEETNTIPYTCKDGTVTTHDSTVYRLRLQTVSEVFAKRFAEQWTVLTGKKPTIQTTVRSKWSESSAVKNHRPTRLYMVQPRYTVLGRFLKHIKYTEQNGSLHVLGYPVETQQGFVHGMIDSEGNVRKNLTLVANMNRTLLETVQAILMRFGRYSAISGPSARNGMYRLATATRYDKFDIPKYRPVNRDWTKYGASLDSDRPSKGFKKKPPILSLWTGIDN